jgi:GNAT superfamily N-acetyltransferase
MEMKSQPNRTEKPVVEIRLAQPADLDAVVYLLGQQLREHRIDTGAAQIRSVIERILADTRLGFVLVATGRDGKPVGVAFGTSILGVEHGGISGWIEELYVLPEFRDKGIGSRMIGEFIRVATELGWRAIDIEVDAGHERVESLYGRNDFQPVPRKRFCRKLV